MRIDYYFVDLVHVGKRQRHLDASNVKELAESMKRIGLQTPITVRIVPSTTDPVTGEVVHDVPVLIAGLHRLEAAKLLGWETIDSFTLDVTEAEAELWEISENLHRADLTELERAGQTTRWIELTESGAKVEAESAENKPAQLGPVSETCNVGGRGNTGGINAAARALGITRQEAQRAVKIAAITEPAKEAAVAAGLDKNQSALLKVAAEPVEKQVAKVAELVETKATQKRERTWSSRPEDVDRRRKKFKNSMRDVVSDLPPNSVRRELKNWMIGFGLSDMLKE